MRSERPLSARNSHRSTRGECQVAASWLPSNACRQRRAAVRQSGHAARSHSHGPCQDLRSETERTVDRERRRSSCAQERLQAPRVTHVRSDPGADRRRLNDRCPGACLASAPMIPFGSDLTSEGLRLHRKVYGAKKRNLPAAMPIASPNTSRTAAWAPAGCRRW